MLRFLAALLIACTSVAADRPASELNVQVLDLRNYQGHLRLGVFDAKDGFPEERNKALMWQSLSADSESRTFKLELPPGRYAVVVLHDENDNRKLDRGFMGIPREGYGVTNNPKPRRRPARFDEAVFELPPDGAAMKISLQYFQ